MKSYSYLLRTHRSSSKIDLVFVYIALLSIVHKASYIAGGLSDQTLLSVTLQFSARFTGGAWGLAPGWLQEENVFQWVNPYFTSYWGNNVDSAQEQVLWDAFKAIMRGEYISTTENGVRFRVRV